MAIKGGEKLQAKLEELAQKISSAQSVEVGFLSGATYPADQGGFPVAFIAAQNEYGGIITVPQHETTINRNIDSEGNFKNGGKFTKESSANFQTTHTVPEYTIKIPPRPFFRGMIASNKDGWGDIMAKLAKNNNYDSEKTLGQMGDIIKGQLQESIRDFKDPPNAASTVTKKGFDNPLIDTGYMFNSVDYQVKE